VTEQSEHVLDDLAAYALGSLDSTEQERIDRHVRVCLSCAGRVADYRRVVSVLPVALTPEAPPADLWAAIRADVRTRGRATASRRQSTVRRWLRAAGWLTAAAAASVLITWNLHLQTQLARYAQGPQVEKLARRPARLIILTGTTSHPQASARVFAAVDGKSGHMAVTGLPMLPSGHVYQLWFLPKTPAPAQKAATFNVDSDGRAWVVMTVPLDLEDTRSLIVTADLAGSSTPDGPPLLEAMHWR
jgi:anti-sigma-K factor RskA